MFVIEFGTALAENWLVGTEAAFVNSNEDTLDLSVQGITFGVTHG